METRHPARRGSELVDAVLGPLTLRDLWQLANRPQHVDGAALRAACLLLLVFYVIAWMVRPAPPNAAVLWLRAAMLAYAAVGAVFAHRVSWPGLRLYTVGMALLLPGTTGTIELLRGNQGTDLALTALSAFAPTVFLQTAADVVLVLAALSGATAVLMATAPPAEIPAAVTGLVLGGAAVCGAAAAIVLIVFRRRISDSTAWWQEACARERTLREFVELGAPHLGDQVLTREFAARFRSASGSTHCAIVLRDPDSGAPTVAATAGAGAGEAAAPTPAALSALMELVADRQTVVRRLGPGDAADGLAGLPGLAAAGTVALVPIVGNDAVVGVVVLSAARGLQVAEEDLLLWRAMANQVAAAVGSARLFARLQQALRARSEFMNTMSHELRSPLHVILGYADVLLEGRQDPAFVARRMRAGALELLQLVENCLAAAQLGTGKMRLQPSEFLMADLVDDLRESLEALPEADGGVPVHWQVEPQLPPVWLDRLKVKEILHNLISNALKFTARGAVTVRIGREADRVRLDIEDTGCGIPVEAQTRIFEMFERVDGDTAGSITGVGLGLYIVKSLVQTMRGTVTLASTPGRGSHFTVLLPMRGDAA